jgi:hypothetical protein
MVITNYALLSLLLTAGSMIIYQALFGGVPQLVPTFLYESMSSYLIYGEYQLLAHPVYTLKQKNSRASGEGRAKQERMVFFSIPGNMGGFI